MNKIKYLWHILRELAGENAYEKYLQHHALCQQNRLEPQPPLTKKQFYQYAQEAKWTGVKRCC